jgi:hypothetical protein
MSIRRITAIGVRFLIDRRSRHRCFLLSGGSVDQTQSLVIECSDRLVKGNGFATVDALLVRGIRTEDIMSPTCRQVHTLTPFAKVRGTTITYPSEDSQSAQTESRCKGAGSQTVKRTRPLSD